VSTLLQILAPFADERSDLVVLFSKGAHLVTEFCCLASAFHFDLTSEG